MRASFADRAFAALERPGQPLDSALLVSFEAGRGPTLAALHDGAARALLAYPRSACRLAAWGFAPVPNARVSITELECTDAREVQLRCRELVRRPFDLRQSLLIEQTLLRADGRTWLLFRMHHALGDMVSAFAWLKAQLTGQTAPATLSLRRATTRVRKSRFAFDGPAALMHTEGKGELERDFASVTFLRPRSAVRAPAAPFSYNDVLAAVALEALAEWNRKHAASSNVALWLPVNLREQAFVGFGNGAGRIRVYRHEAASFAQRAAQVRQQVQWSKEHGEWAVPPLVDALATVRAFAEPLARSLASRRGVDMATALFSHVDRLAAPGESAPLPGAQAIQVITHQLAAHPLSMVALSWGGQTQLSFTWHAGRLSADEARSFIDSVEALRGRAFAELYDA